MSRFKAITMKERDAIVAALQAREVRIPALAERFRLSPLTIEGIAYANRISIAGMR